ncbi:MAG: hypothetical protein ACI8TQ_001168 [Planctomycetota bacterium]
MNPLKSFFSRSAPVELVLYSRPDCPLCDEMLEELERSRTRSKWKLRVVNIETAPELEALHGRSIPVLEIAGKLAFKGNLTVLDFERKFARLTAL